MYLRAPASIRAAADGLVEPPAPIMPPRVNADDPPARLEPHEKMRLRAAAFRATRLWPKPDPIGELISRELLAWEEFGYRFGRGLVMRLVEHVERQP